MLCILSGLSKKSQIIWQRKCTWEAVYFHNCRQQRKPGFLFISGMNCIFNLIVCWLVSSTTHCTWKMYTFEANSTQLQYPLRIWVAFFFYTTLHRKLNIEQHDSIENRMCFGRIGSLFITQQWTDLTNHITANHNMSFVNIT